MTAAPPVRRRSDLLIRSVTGIVLILVALASVVLGDIPFWLLMSAAALLMIAEWAGLVRAQRWQMWLAFLGLLFPLICEESHLNMPLAVPWEALLAAAAVVGLLTRSVRVMAGMAYVGLPVLSLFYLEGQYDGPMLTLWTLAVVWATDIGAYFAGRGIGGPKLAPTLSPNKTWAGLIGGTLAAIAVGLILAHVFRLPVRLAAFSGLLALAAQAGDIYESAMKRRAGVKDSGHILPGHGGAMDRLDGAVPVACIVAAIVASGLLTA